MKLLKVNDVFPTAEVTRAAETVQMYAPKADLRLVAAIMVLPYDAAPGINTSVFYQNGRPVLRYQGRAFYHENRGDVFALARNIWWETRVVRTGNTIGELAGSYVSGSTRYTRCLPWLGIDIGSVAGSPQMSLEDMALLVDTVVTETARNPDADLIYVELPSGRFPVDRMRGNEWELRRHSSSEFDQVEQEETQLLLMERVARAEVFLNTHLPLHSTRFELESLSDEGAVAVYRGALSNGLQVEVPVVISPRSVWRIGVSSIESQKVPLALPEGFINGGISLDMRPVVIHQETNIRMLVAAPKPSV